MKVLCVKKPLIGQDGRMDYPSPEVGDEDTVVGDKTVDGKLFYKLERFPKNLSYLSSYLAILPDSTDDELEEEETIAEPITA